MVNWTNLLSGAANTAGTAKDEATKTTRRKFVTGTGATLLGLGAAEKLTGGAVSDTGEAAAETAGNWWEEIVEDPMGLDIETVNEYNEAVNEFEAKFDDHYLSEHHQARATEDVGRMPSDLKAGDSLDNGQYKALGFNKKDINDSEGDHVIDRVLDGEFTVLTPDAVSMANGTFGDEFGAVAINQDQNEYDASDIRQMRNAYREAAQTSQDWMVRINELQTEGESLDRLSTEYEDEEEIPAVQQARDHQEYLGKREDELLADHLRFRAQANLFEHTLQNSEFEEEEDTPTETPSDGYGEHDTYGDIAEYCDFEDDTINELHDWMDDNGVDSYDEIGMDTSSTNGDYTVEFTYEGDTISKDHVEGCGA